MEWGERGLYMGKYLIRPAIEPEEIAFRTGNAESGEIEKIRSGLRKLHTFEVMAVNIYRLQITNEANELNTLLIQAMANEMTHVQDFQIKLYEYGAKPSLLRFFFGPAGCIIGFLSRLGGERRVLKTGVWVETKAVNDYQKIIDSAKWDEGTLKVIKKNLTDEHHHIKSMQERL